MYQFKNRHKKPKPFSQDFVMKIKGNYGCASK